MVSTAPTLMCTHAFAEILCWRLMVASTPKLAETGALSVHVVEKISSGAS